MQVVKEETAYERRTLLDEAPTSSPAHSDQEYTMQQVVELTGMGEHALRFYERAGLLPPVRRQPSSGHRRYSAADVALIETLACLRAAGMSLTQMRHYLELAPQGAAAAPQAQAILTEQRHALEEQLYDLRRRLEHLDHKVAYWRAVEAHDEQAVADLARQFAERIRADACGR